MAAFCRVRAHAELGEESVKINELNAAGEWPTENRGEWTQDLQSYFRTCFKSRWNEWHNDLQAAEYCLDPEIWSHKQYGNAEVMRGMRATCRKLLSPDKAAKAMSQLMLFLRKEVAFAQEEAWEEAKHMNAVQWWLAWGAMIAEGAACYSHFGPF